MKRLAPGYYAGKMIRSADLATVTVEVCKTDGGEWYYLIDSKDATDMFPSKARAISAAVEFLGKCYFDDTWGWVMPG